MKKNYTHMAVVLDKSGSMSSVLNDTIGGFNQFLKNQKEVKGEATITLVQFSDNYNILMDMAPLADAEDLTIKNYVPEGYTALLDAIGRTINRVEGQIDDKPKKQRPEKVVFVIITDGEENRSKEFNREQIMKMIDSHRTEKKWEFVFIGANQDSIKAGGSIGVRAGSTLDYMSNSQGINTMYCTLTKGMTSYRSKSAKDLDKSLGFFDDKK